MKKYSILILVILGLLSNGMFAQNVKKYVRRGNNQFDKGDYSEAEVQYRKALDKNPNYYKGKFNLGDAMYKQENFKESGKMFNELSAANINPNDKAAAYYNLGNTLMKDKKYQESIDAFKQSLKLKPDNYDAKYNLEYARKMLKNQQKQKQQNKNKKKDQNKKDQNKKDQNKKNQDKKDQQKQKNKQDQKDKQKDQQQNKQNPSDQKKQKQQQQQQQISKNDAQRMLQALKNDEKKTLQKLEKLKAKAVKAVKSDIDW